MPEFNTDLPSIRKLQTYIQDKPNVEIKLLTNDLLQGKILWQDHNCICMQDNQGESILIWREAIAYVKVKS